MRSINSKECTYLVGATIAGGVVGLIAMPFIVYAHTDMVLQEL